MAIVFTGDEDITELSDDEFLELVNLDIRGIAPKGLSQQLHEPQNLVEWYDGLCTTKRKVESRISLKRADLVGKVGHDSYMDFRADFMMWRAKALDFLFKVEVAIALAKRELDAAGLSY